MQKLKLKIHLVIFLSACFIAGAYAQQNTRKEILIPDIGDYITLKCDFHIHTVFSDGKVWPEIRVAEAWSEGLDAIAITDHVEILKHKDDIVSDRNRSAEIAMNKAHDYGIIVIRGAEITRWYPHGHHNCLFINDAEKLNKEEPIEAIEQAGEQDAFIFWNHPGWKQENNIPIWYDFQTELYDKGLMDGIEIVNGIDHNYYPLAHQWAIDKGLTLLGNSDIHGPVHFDYDLSESHRAMTLVFVKERSKKGIREALENGRTAVYYGDTLIGDEAYLRPVFEKSVEVLNPAIEMKEGQLWMPLMIRNHSDVPVHLRKIGDVDPVVEVSDGLYIPAGKTVKMVVKGKPEGFTGRKEIAIPYVAENFYIEPRKGMPVEIKFTVMFLED